MTRTPLIHLCVALALLAAGASAYVWWYVRVESASSRAAGLAADVEQKEADLLRIRSASAALADLSEDEAAVGRYFVTSSGIVSFLEYLETAGTGLGADVEVVSVSSEGSPRARLSVSARLIGSFEAVARTFGRIEYGPYDVRIGNTTVDTSGDGAWSAVTVFSVGMKEAGVAPPRTP